MTTVSLATGGGTVARRAHALLFAPEAGSPVLRPFLDAADAAAARSAVTSALIEAEFQVDPFALVTWDDGFQLLVFGALEVKTDLPELPMLSGAGSASWVERRVVPVPDAVRVHAGEPAVEGTDLTGGVVLAGGFDATITPEPPPTAASGSSPGAEAAEAGATTSTGRPSPGPATSPTASASTSSPSTATPSTSGAATSGAAPSSTGGAGNTDAGASAPVASLGGVDDHDTEVVPQVDEAGPPADDPIASRADGLAALYAATGGDWMEDSLGLGGVPIGAAQPAGETGDVGDDPPATEIAPDDELDDEVTLGRDDVLPAGPAGSAPAPSSAPPDPPVDTTPPTGPSSALPPPTGNPRQVVFNGRDDGVDERAIVTARECPTGHLNAPHASRCRICDAEIHPDAATVTVRQPVLGLVIVPDGSAYPIDSTMVVGRKPDTDAAKVDPGARTIRIDTSSAVSRTHLVIRPEGWTITVTDCGSRGGSVVISEPDADPEMLQPWVPQETPIGSEVYLGGPTKIVIAKPGGLPPAGGALDTLELPELPD